MFLAEFAPFLTMPRLVRRTPLLERIKSMLNPMDFLLWLSEELETRDWDSTTAGTQLGLAMNFVFLVARANSASSTSDDVFSDDVGTGWLAFFVSCLGPLVLLKLTKQYQRFTLWSGSSSSSRLRTLSTRLREPVNTDFFKLMSRRSSRHLLHAA